MSICPRMQSKLLIRVINIPDLHEEFNTLSTSIKEWQTTNRKSPQTMLDNFSVQPEPLSCCDLLESRRTTAFDLERSHWIRHLDNLMLQHHGSQQQLKELFDQFGEVQEVTVPKNKATNSTKGFAFVLYHNGISADRLAPCPSLSLLSHQNTQELSRWGHSARLASNVVSTFATSSKATVNFGLHHCRTR